MSKWRHYSENLANNLLWITSWMWQSEQPSLLLLATSSKFWHFLSCRAKKGPIFTLSKVTKISQEEHQYQYSMFNRIFLSWNIKKKKCRLIFGNIFTLAKTFTQITPSKRMQQNVIHHNILQTIRLILTYL